MKLALSWLLSLSTLLLTTLVLAASPILLPAWQSDAVFEQPESVIYDQKRQLLYVSNVNGDPIEADGSGYISQLSLKGELINQHWLDGLNAPKGMILVDDILYVADINELVEIDIKNNKIQQRYLAGNAKFFNDVTADAAGNIYVSDMLTNTIHCLCSGEFSVWLQDERLEAPNGLFVEGSELIVGSWGNMTDGFATAIAGHLKTINIASKTLESLGDKSPAGNLDGLEADGNDNYYVTDWMMGKLLHITPSGITTTLLSLEQGSADHTVLADQGLIIIPMMLSGNVIAYQIK